MVAVTFIRNILSMIMVFALSPWIAGMGVYNMFILLGVLSLTVCATCVPMLIYGKKLRIKCADNYKKFAARQFKTRV
jgi:hypothetical protein